MLKPDERKCPNKECQFKYRHAGECSVVLLDRFAKAAMSELTEDSSHFSGFFPGNIIAEAYRIADAMMTAREMSRQ